MYASFICSPLWLQSMPYSTQLFYIKAYVKSDASASVTCQNQQRHQPWSVLSGLSSEFCWDSNLVQNESSFKEWKYTSTPTLPFSSIPCTITTFQHESTVVMRKLILLDGIIGDDQHTDWCLQELLTTGGGGEHECMNYPPVLMLLINKEFDEMLWWGQRIE